MRGQETRVHHVAQQKACEANKFTWFEVALSDVIDVPYPVCARTGYSRENHLGNSLDPVVDTTPKHPTELDEAQEAAPHFLNANRCPPPPGRMALSRMGLSPCRLRRLGRYLWQIPTIPTVKAPLTADQYFAGVKGNRLVDAYKSCVLRLRYNLSSSDFPSVRRLPSVAGLCLS